MFKIRFEDKGEMHYQEALDYQRKCSEEILLKRGSASAEDLSGILIFCEHPHVYTLGKSGSLNNLLVNDATLKEKGATFFHTDRGGDITYHGPGQIVGYPIIDLNRMNIGVKEYVHWIEDAIIRTLRHFNIQGERLDGATGVWVDPKTKNARKICAIGVRVSRGITMHGFAFNVNTDLSFFKSINPCGFTDKSVTSLEKELGGMQNFEEVKSCLKENFARVFGMEFSR